MRKRLHWGVVAAVVIILILSPLAARWLNRPEKVRADTFLKFDEGYGTTSAVNDSNGAIAAGSITGATWKTEDLCFDNKCLFFDGNQDYVSFGDDPDLDFAGADSFTITGWFRHGPASAVNVILAKYETADTTDGGYKVLMEADGDITCGIDNDNSFPSDSVTSTAATYDDNRWHHFACVKNASTSLSLYIDAQLIGTDSSITSSSLANDDSFYAGIDGDGSSNDYTGFIDEVKVYRSAKTAALIKGDFVKSSPLGEASASFGIRDYSYLSEGLVGYWKMNEDSWTNNCSTDSALDSSGNNFNGDSCPDISGPTATTVGKFGKAGNFDGTDDNISIADNDTLSFLNTNFSISAWVKMNSTEDNPLVTKGQGTLRTGYHIMANQYGNFIIYYSETADGSDDSFTFGTYSTGTWYNIVMTVDKQANLVKGYVNGVYGGSKDITGKPDDITTTFTMLFGRTGSFYANAVIDEVRAYNRALTPIEVSALYNWAPGPVVSYKMDENSGTTSINDTSGNGNTGTMTGTMTGDDWVPGKFGSALDFDGSDDAITIATANDSDVDFNGSEAFSGSAWVYVKTMPGSGNQDAIITKYDETSTLRGYRLVVENDDADATGNFQVEIYDESAVQSISASGANDTVGQNTWYHILFTFNGGVAGATGDLKLYTNGVFTGNNSLNGSFLGLEDIAVDFSIGDYDATDAVANNTAFTGIIDDAKIYNYVRTPGQIIEDMNAGHPTPGSPIGSAVAEWKFDEGALNTCSGGANDFCDSSTNANDLLFSTTTGGFTNSGKFGKAFDGTGAVWASKTDDSDFDFTDTEDFTISGWFNHAAASAQEVILQKFDAATGADGGYIIRMESDGDITFGSDNDDTSFPTDSVSSTAATYDDGTWHQFTAVKDGTTDIRIYIDGIHIATTTVTETGSTLANDDSLFIADSNGTDDGDEFNGDLDEIKIYRSALTADQVKVLYSQGAAAVLGATSTDSSGNATWSSINEYCPPGQGSSCTAPIAEWKFDENTGQNVYDTSGSGNAGTLGVNSSSGSDDPAWAGGKLGSALDFENTATQDYVLITDSYLTTSPLYIANNGTVTITAWVKAESFPGTDTNAYIAGRGYWPDTEAYTLRVNIDGGGTKTLQFGSYSSGTDYFATWTIAGWNTGEWHQVAGSYNGSTWYVYFDGVLKASNTTTGPFANDAYFAIGAWWGGGSVDRFWDGLIDNVRVYNYARTSTQIAWEYNRGKPVAYWKFDESSWTNNCATDTVFDSSSWVSHGDSCPNGSGQTTPEAGKRNNAIHFDDSDDYISVADANNLDLTSSISISAWVNTDANEADNVIISKGTSYEVGVNADGDTYWYNGSTTEDDASTKVQSGAWHHVVITDNDTTVTYYVDGIQTGTDSSGIGADNATALYIGYDGTNYFDGLIDDVKVFNYVLTPQQVRDNFDQGSLFFGPNTGSP
ncbi:hypothetical protein A2783_05805 [Microgenomates group bacterium RIFCSPHIGHO2_01_FULL_45_11]|nr:MAG: hypothetical protein A2783_05805 [Microgenomates group bacterium RIFCSPHIGHO2_01_FULL_45_11]